MGKELFSAKGSNGTLYVYEDRIEIKREGFKQAILSSGHGNKEIRMDDITGIEVSEGFIQFTEQGFNNDEASLFSAPQDENTVYLDKSDSEMAKEIINEHRFNSRDSSGSGLDSAYSELRKEFARGNITEQEYNKRLNILEETEQE